MKEQEIRFEKNPFKVQGFKLEPGKIIMGPTPDRDDRRFELDIESNGRDLDRKT